MEYWKFQYDSLSQNAKRTTKNRNENREKKNKIA